MDENLLMLVQRGVDPEIGTAAALAAFSRLGKSDQDEWIKLVKSKICVLKGGEDTIVPDPSVDTPKESLAKRTWSRRKKQALETKSEPVDPFKALEAQ